MYVHRAIAGEGGLGSRVNRTQLRKGNELASCLAGLVDPVDGSTDGFLQVKPAWFGVDGGSLVLLENSCHGCCWCGLSLQRW